MQIWLGNPSKNYPIVVRHDTMPGPDGSTFDAILRKGDNGYTLGLVNVDGEFDGQDGQVWLDGDDTREFLKKVKPFSDKKTPEQEHAPSIGFEFRNKFCNAILLWLRRYTRELSIFNRIVDYPDHIKGFSIRHGGRMPIAISFRRGSKGVIASIALGQGEPGASWYLGPDQTTRFLQFCSDIHDVVFQNESPP